MPTFRVHRGQAALLALLLVLPADLHAHVRLESSVPAADAVLTVPPASLLLRFTARIEQRYTQLVLVGPDERVVPIGTIEFVNGSDREFRAAVPPLAVSGRYTVRWRTAGADGHPLEGSFGFTLDLATDPAPVHSDPSQPPPPQHAHGDVADSSASSGPQTLARALHFLALTLLIGAVAFRVLLMPRLSLGADVAGELRRRVWRVAAFAALALVAAAILRLWLQSSALHGADRAWSPPLLSLMLTGTTWGRAWVIQAALLGLFAAAVAAARPRRDRFALALAVPAALGLAAIPALTGHAAGVEDGARLVILNDALHVIAASTWLGTLAIIPLAALPTLTTRDIAADRGIADMIDRFSPLALTAACVLVATGVVNSLLHFDAIADVTRTTYGRTLLIKLTLFTGVLTAGAFNWRRQRPRLGGAGSAALLRRSIALELAFALAVIAITGYLTGLPRPS